MRLRLPGEDDDAWLKRVQGITERMASRSFSDFLGRIAAGDEEALELSSALLGIDPQDDDNADNLEPEASQEELDALFNKILDRINDHNERLLAGDPEAVITQSHALYFGHIIDSLPQDPFIEE